MLVYLWQLSVFVSKRNSLQVLLSMGNGLVIVSMVSGIIGKPHGVCAFMD